MSHDLVTLGEAMLRLWVPRGQRLEDAPEFKVTVAGAEANVAIAVARAGLSVAWISRLPSSSLGRRAAREISGHGVDVSHVMWDPTGRMGTYFVELSVPPRPVTVIYDRADSAFASMTSDEVVWDAVEAARAVHVTGITPALSPQCRAVTEEFVTRARQAGAVVIVDVNYRSRLWSPPEAAGTVAALCEGATVAIVTTEDARDLFGIDASAPKTAAAFRQMTGAETVVATEGATGAAWDGASGAGSRPGHRADVIDRIGAGDAFAAGVIIGLLEGDVGSGVDRGLAMAALKLGISGDQLVASQDEIDALMQDDIDREVQR